MNKNQLSPLEQLNSVITDTVSHISDFTKNPSDFTRNRKLNAESTIKVTLNMAGQSLNKELIDAFPLMDDRMTSSAFIQQKNKLSPELFMHIFKEFNNTTHKKNLFNDKYELYAIDGSDFNIPFQQKSKYAIINPKFKPKKNGEQPKPFSQLHANLLYNITDRTYDDLIIQKQSDMDERRAAIDMLSTLHPSNPYIVIMDRGYDGFNMIEHGNRLNGEGYFVIRTKTGSGGIREIASLPNAEFDKEMTFRVTTSNRYYIQHKDVENIHLINSPKNQRKNNPLSKTRYQKWDFGQFAAITCRVVKFRINNSETGREEWEVLLTNLNRFEFPIEKMKELYHQRWDIETSFRDLKYSLGAIQFHSRKDDFVEMELISQMIMFNAVSRAMNEISVPQSADKKYKYALSFKEAVVITRKYFRLYNTEPHRHIFGELLGYTHPVVSGRSDKRDMKSKSAVWFVYRVA